MYCLESNLFGQKIRCINFTPSSMTTISIPPYTILTQIPSVRVDLKQNLLFAYVRDRAYNYLASLRHITPVSLREYNREVTDNAKQRFPFLFTHVLQDSYQKYLDTYCWALINLSKVDIHFTTCEFVKFMMHQDPAMKITHTDELISIVGVPNLENAYYNSYCCVYGSGASRFTVLTSLDIIAHELSHGITGHMSDLEYKGESGALNEAFSDIMACAFEDYMYQKYRYLKGCKDWLIGEDVCLKEQSLRNFMCPNQCGQPEKCNGKYYVDPKSNFDYGGVHINSGIINHLFYKLCQHERLPFVLQRFIRVYKQLQKKSVFKDFIVLLLNDYKNVHKTLDLVCVLNRYLESLRLIS